MGTINVNLAGVKTELEAVPAGTYEAVVASAQVTEAKSSGKPMLSVKLRIEAPEELNGRMLFDNFSLQSQALWKLKRWLLALGYEPDELETNLELDPEELVGQTCYPVVVNEMYQGQERSRVTGYDNSLSGAGLDLEDMEGELDKIDFSFD